jgi:hypothetical protein
MSLYEEQYYLSKECGISISESNEMFDVERKMFLGFLIRDKKEELKKIKERK